MAQRVMESVNFAYGEDYRIFDTTIPYSIKAVEAGSEGKSIYEFQKDNAVSKAYENLTMEVRNGREKTRVDTIKETAER
jgi:chromosome partitioning protein